MFKKFLIAHVVFIAACFISADVNVRSNSKDICVETFAEFRDAVDKEILTKYKKESILFVYDIDCTLLKMRHPISFGGEPWFDWQSSTKKSFTDLLKLQLLLFVIGKMKPVEQEIPEILNNWHLVKGYRAVILSARGCQTDPLTLTELKSNKIYIHKYPTLTPLPCFQPYIPYEKGKYIEYGLRKDQVLNAPRKVSFNNGVFLVQGQDKGIMLRSLLFREKELVNIKVIIFIDDSYVQIGNMINAFSDLPKENKPDIYAFRYKHEDSYKEQIIKDKKLQEECNNYLKLILDALSKIYKEPGDTAIPLHYPTK